MQTVYYRIGPDGRYWGNGGFDATPEDAENWTTVAPPETDVMGGGTETPVWDGKDWVLQDTKSLPPIEQKPAPTVPRNVQRIVTDPFSLAKREAGRNADLSIRIDAIEARLRALEPEPTPTPGEEERE